MIISRIQKGVNIYYNLHAEQTVTGTFLDEPGNGVFEEILTHTTIDNITSDLASTSTKESNLVLDFANINGCQNNIKKKIITLINKFRLIVLTNISDKIVEDIEVGIFSNSNNLRLQNGYSIFYLSNTEVVKLESDSETIFNEELLNKLKKHTETDTADILHDSSSVYLTSYINIKSFISQDKSFFIYAIYFLALKIKKHWAIEISSLNDIDKPTLICQNLNSAFITSVLSSLLKLDILILDKIGPINKLYSTLDRKIEESKKYIVVSDLVCLGTEIKIAKSLIEFLGGKYIGSASVIRVETLLPNHRTFDDTECVFVINKGNCMELGYGIKTALNF